MSVLSQTIVNTAGKCFHLNLKRSQTRVPLRREKKSRTFFKSDWTCFKANYSASYGHRSSQTLDSNKNYLSRKRRNGRDSGPRFNIPIIQTVFHRFPQTPGTDVSICLRRDADLSAIVSQTDRETVADHMGTRLKNTTRELCF